MKTSDLFVKSLENEGVRYIFGLPGEENLDFLDSLRKSKLTYIPTRLEEGAGFMAATIGRLTGAAAVALSTLGPGSTNLMTTVAYSQLGGMPAVFITGQKPIKRNKQGYFQIINTVEMMRPVTKYTKQIAYGDAVPSLVREAFKVAEEERPGAVHLELPEDVAYEDADAPLIKAERTRRPIAEEKAVDKAAELISKASHPLILIGAGANRKRVSKMLTDFIKKTQIPFFNTQMGKGVVDERHPLYLGTAALSENDFVHCAINHADLIINIGHDTVEKPPFIMTVDGAKVIHVNFSQAAYDEIYFPQLEVIGDIANAIWQIGQKLKKQSHWNFAYYLKLKRLFKKHIASHINLEKFPYTPAQVVADVRDSMDSSDIVVLDNGMYKIWFARNYPAYLPNTLLLDNALATMGAGLPSGIAVKLIFPQKKVVVVTGDGGFLMTSAELETAQRLGLDLIIVILNDNGFGMIEWKQKLSGLPKFGLHFGNPDFIKYARSFGAEGQRVKKYGDLKKMLGRASEKGGIQLIEVPIDYSDNEKVLTDELSKITCKL
jgi:acetolactate synthase-1/2/3 large subunit